MKHICILLLAIGLASNSAKSQTTDSTLNQLLSINKANYLNMPLDSILAVIPPGYVSMKIYGIRNTARFLSVKYANQVWIELHVRHFSFMNQVDPNRIWNISQMRQEDLHSVSVYKGVNCYEGCPGY